MQNSVDMEFVVWFWHMCICVFLQNMSTCVEALYFFYTLVGAIILIVMSALAGAALRSTKSQVKRQNMLPHTLQTAESCACIKH